MEEKFKCLMVRGSDDSTDEKVRRRIEEISLDDLQDGHVVIRNHFSSLNYKDALAANGHLGVVRQLPHVPGIDAAGEVVSSTDPFFNVGDKVMVFHADFGTVAFGGYSQFIRVPKEWVYHIPAGMNLRDTMVYGTAGFTAAQSVEEIVRHGVAPASGTVLVTGSTGGVGSMAVQILTKLGYDVAAVTGKLSQHDWLRSLGAKEILSREEASDESGRPMLKTRWAGVIDTVGGQMLASAMKATNQGGCVTACGLVGGHEISTTVYPFILRGITLQGIDSANISYETRKAIWDKLAADYALADVGSTSTTVTLQELDSKIVDILAGKISGRVVVDCS